MQMNEAGRVRQGANVTTAPDILKQLANDPSVTVRATLALNPAAPLPVNAILANDPDERVRSLLARKLAVLAPTLDGEAQGQLRHATVETLMALVADEAERVRASIAEVVKHMPDAPRHIILRLAHDPAVMVCEPVIRFSPLLTSQDLVTLIAAAPSTATIKAVAHRSEIDAAVSEAIVSSADTDAIRALLANHSAQIREVTLDALIAQAAGCVEWHAPLVRRPRLPARAARALAEIVTDHLLEVLSTRDDLDPALADDLRRRLEQAGVAAKPAETPLADLAAQAAMARAAALGEAGRLNDEVILNAARQGDVKLMIAIVSVKAGLSPEVIERASSLRSAKALVSLAWKAGLSMQVGLALQIIVARLAPDALIHPVAGGGFPMSVQEMQWQLEFLHRTAR